MKRSPLKRKTPLRKTRRKPSLRKKLWPEFSKLIRARDKVCRFAGYFGRRCGGNLQACHLLPKGRHPLLELHPLNVVAGCYVCHLHGWHKDPMTAARWIQENLTLEQLGVLLALRRDSLSRKGMTEQEIRAEWKHHGLTP